MASNLPPFPPFDLSDKNTVGVRWQKWVRRFENLMTGMNITNAVRKMALMSHYAGVEEDNIIDTLVIPAPAGDANKYTVFRDALNAYVLPQANTEYPIYEFRTRAQEQGETLNMYVTELKKLAKSCNFQNLDRELKSQIIQNCRSTKLHTQSLENRDWMLKQVLDKGTAMERQSGNIEDTKYRRTESKRTSTRASQSSNRERARKNRRDNPKHTVDVAIHMVVILKIAPHTDKQN